jgi:hypothetical protein
MGKETLWGERNILIYLLNLALNTDRSQVFKIIFLSGLSKAFGYQSDVYIEFKEQLLNIIHDDADKTSAFSKLSPLAFKIMGLNEEFESRKKELIDQYDASYRSWLENLGS